MDRLELIVFGDSLFVEPHFHSFFAAWSGSYDVQFTKLGKIGRNSSQLTLESMEGEGILVPLFMNNLHELTEIDTLSYPIPVIDLVGAILGPMSSVVYFEHPPVGIGKDSFDI